MLFQRVKPTTGLVGVPVQPRWRDMILKLCDETLTELDTLPKGVFWRVATENNIRFIQRVVSENEDYEKVEDIVNRGQVEQIIMLFEDTLTLIPKMREWQPWEITAESVKLERETYENGPDPSFPKDYVSPLLGKELKTWSGQYTVEISREELEEKLKREEEEKKKREEEAKKASAPPKK